MHPFFGMLRNTPQKKLLSRCVLRDTPKIYWEGDSRHCCLEKKMVLTQRVFHSVDKILMVSTAIDANETSVSLVLL